jgi:hypothetical protein
MDRLVEDEAQFARVVEYLGELRSRTANPEDRAAIERVMESVKGLLDGLNRRHALWKQWSSDEWRLGFKCSFCYKLDHECGPVMAGAKVAICASCAARAVKYIDNLAK